MDFCQLTPLAAAHSTPQNATLGYWELLGNVPGIGGGGSVQREKEQ